MGGKPPENRWKSDQSDPQSAGMTEFLRQLPEEELLGLVKTTTGGLIYPTNTDDAIEVMINFSDAVSLLNRRRVKKEYLVKYLASRKVSFTIQSDKTKLCHLILKLWGVVQGSQLKFNDYESNDVKTGPPRRSSRLRSSGIADESDNSQQNNATNEATATNSAISLVAANQEDQMEEDEDYLPLNSVEVQTGQMLAFQFAEWYYSRLNRLEDFTVDHFWPDCNLRLQVTLAGSCDNRQETCIQKDGLQTYSLLRSLVAEQGCFFNPNTLNGIGIRGIVNPHGLAQVTVCGTVHRGTTAVGTFEQLFGLMKDPNKDNNFKIKFTVLRLQEQGALEQGVNQNSVVSIVEEPP